MKQETQTAARNPLLFQRIWDHQRQSWQIEILIASGLILFLYHMPDFLIRWLVDIQEGKVPRAEEVILFFGGYIFSRALLIGFALSLFLRSLWMAFLGIYQAFPGGINFHRLSYSKYFEKKTGTSKSGAEKVLQFDRICSLAFSVTIMVTMLTVGIFFLLAVIFYSIYYLMPSIYTPGIGFIILIVLFAMMLGITDWIFFGWLKRFPIVSKVYYPFYRLFRLLTFSFFYQDEYLTFLSNVKRWKAYAVFLLFFGIAVFTSTSEIASQFGGNTVFPHFSLDERKFGRIPSLQTVRGNNYENMITRNRRILNASIQSDIVADRYLKLFVVYIKSFDEPLDSLFREYGVKTFLSRKTFAAISKNDSLIEKALHRFFSIRIDNHPVPGLKWHFHRHPVTGELGFLSYIPIQSFKPGEHLLRVGYLITKNGKFLTRYRATIPFLIQRE